MAIGRLMLRATHSAATVPIASDSSSPPPSAAIERIAPACTTLTGTPIATVQPLSARRVNAE